jgi:hypothetical protein
MKRVKINTTISESDKQYLDQTGINVSTALSMGVKLIQNTLGTATVAPARTLANLALPAIDTQSSSQLKNTPLSDTEIDSLIEQRIAALRQASEKLPWRTPAEVRAYFSKKKTTLHGLEEVRVEEDQNVP